VLFDKRLAGLKGGIRTWSVPLSRRSQRYRFGFCRPIQLCGSSGKGQSANTIIKASAIKCMGLEDIANQVEGDPGICHARNRWLNHKAMDMLSAGICKAGPFWSSVR